MDENAGNSQATAKTSQQIHGIFEAEISCGDEVDLHRHLDQCEKNPNHKTFIPVDDFSIDHLPPQYRDIDIVNLIQALSVITVRIDVRCTSNERPDVYPDSGKPYPSSELRGKEKMRTGSGWVWRVNIFSTLSYNGKTCPCKECRTNHRRQFQWAVIEIYTVTHLIYNETEGAHATCHFFYDRNSIKLNDIPSVRGATRVVNDYNNGDTCRMTYITHDIDLANKLLDKWRLYKSLHTTVGEKYNTIENDNQARPDNDHKLTIIVSHPHGCSKQISIGYFTERQEMEYNDVYTKYTYTVPTCPGSSGAPVYILSRWWWWGCDHPHSGQCEDNKELNYSGVAMY